MRQCFLFKSGKYDNKKFIFIKVLSVLLLNLLVFKNISAQEFTFTLVDGDHKAATYEETGKIEVGLMEPVIVNGNAETIVGYWKDMHALKIKGWVTADKPDKVHIYVLSKKGLLGTGIPDIKSIEKISGDRYKAFWELYIYANNLDENIVYIIGKPAWTGSGVEDVEKANLSFKYYCYGIGFYDIDHLKAPQTIFSMEIIDKKGKVFFKRDFKTKGLWEGAPPEPLTKISIPFGVKPGMKIKIINADGTPNKDFEMYYCSEKNSSKKYEKIDDWIIPGDEEILLFMKKNYEAKTFINVPVYVGGAGKQKLNVEYKIGCDGDKYESVFETYGSITYDDKVLLNTSEKLLCGKLGLRVVSKEAKSDSAFKLIDNVCFDVGKKIEYFSDDYTNMLSDPHLMFEIFLKLKPNSKEYNANIYVLNQKEKYDYEKNGYESVSPVYRVMMCDNNDSVINADIQGKVKFEYTLPEKSTILGNMEKLFELEPKNKEYESEKELVLENMLNNLALYKLNDTGLNKASMKRLDSYTTYDEKKLIAESDDFIGDYVVLPAKYPPQFQKLTYIDPFISEINHKRSVIFYPASVTSRFVKCKTIIKHKNENPKIVDSDQIELQINRIDKYLDVGESSFKRFFSNPIAKTEDLSLKQSQKISNALFALTLPEVDDIGVYYVNTILYDVFGNSSNAENVFMVTDDKPGIITIGETPIKDGLILEPASSEGEINILGNIYLPEEGGSFKVGYRSSFLREDSVEESMEDYDENDLERAKYYSYTYIEINKNFKQYKLIGGMKKYGGIICSLDLKSMSAQPYDIIVKYYDKKNILLGWQMYKDITIKR